MKKLTSLIILLLVGCGGEQPEAPSIVVYLANEDARITGMLSEFTAETGIPIDYRRGSAAELADALINKVGEPADLFIADSVADHWRAAESGALRPIASAALSEHHASLRDPDGLWFALEIRPHAIVHLGATDPSRVSYEELGNPEFSGRVCLSSSSLASNRTLLANLVATRGELETERLVRRWIRNLAQAPYPSSDELRDAIQAGTCEFGTFR